MNNRQREKLRKRLFVTLISILSCIAIMGVGVYAAQSSFTVQVSNEVSIGVKNVDGELWGKRYGDVLLGTVSMGDAGLSSLVDQGVIGDVTEKDGTIDEFIYLYGADNTKHYPLDTRTGYREHEQNMNRIEEKVNFYTQNKDNLTIYYVFKFELLQGSVCSVNIQLTNNTTILNDDRAKNVTENYKYFFGKVEPTNWASSGTSFAFDNNRVANITCDADNTATHTVYIMASLTVTRTNTLESAYTLGLTKADSFNWRFGLNFTPL